jgi:hypothetical protein
MGTTDKLAARIKATESLMQLYAFAKECKSLHLKAGLPVPREVSLLMTWGEDEAKAESGESKRTLLTIPPPFPVGEKGWISVDLAEAMPITIVPAILRDYSEPLPESDVVALVEKLGIKATEGSIQNIGTKLDAKGIIERSESGWRLLDADRAARIAGGRLLGPPSVFQLQEIAAHRRDAEISYLQEYGKLSRSQLISLLQQSDWVNAPVNEFLVKADLLALKAAKRVQRAKSDNPRSWEWELRRKGLRLANSAR